MNKKKVLVVDDDLDILEVLKFLLTKNGYDVKVLSEGNKVIETIKEAKSEIVLMDINLSGYDGREICKYMKTVLKVNTPIVLFSANNTYMDSYKEYGANDFIEKPFEVEKLLNVLHSFTTFSTNDS